MPGKLIVLYGINNLGKTTQAKLLVEYLKKKGFDAEYIKYPIYDIEPSGIMINEYLRKGNSFDLNPRELQILYAFNRTQYEPELRKKLAAGKIIVAEDYTGTGIAWGMAYGVERDFLERINSFLLKEDVAFLFDGERFLSGKELNHTHEKDAVLMGKCRETHKILGKDYGWLIINANQTIEKIHNELIDKIKIPIAQRGGVL